MRFLEKYFLNPWSDFTNYKGRMSRKVYWIFFALNMFCIVFFCYASLSQLFQNAMVQSIFREFSSFLVEGGVDAGWSTWSIAITAKVLFATAISALLIGLILFSSIYFFVALFFMMVPAFVGDNIVAMQLFSLFMMAFSVPYLSATIRRLHDAGFSGWLFFVQLMPVVGGFALIVMLLMSGQKGTNKWGEMPKDVE